MNAAQSIKSAGERHRKVGNLSDPKKTIGSTAGTVEAALLNARRGKGTTASGNGCRTTGRNGQSARQFAAEVKLRENQKEALQYRTLGYTYAQIAGAMAVSISTAHNWVMSALQEIPKENAELVLAQEVDRLDAMMRKAMGSFMEAQGSAAHKDIEVLLKLQDRRLRLYGVGKNRQGCSKAHDDCAQVRDRMLEQMRADAPILLIAADTPLPKTPTR
jgi:DNA-binding CsgD family transcriptional regulator